MRNSVGACPQHGGGKNIENRGKDRSKSTPKRGRVVTWLNCAVGEKKINLQRKRTGIMEVLAGKRGEFLEGEGSRSAPRRRNSLKVCSRRGARSKFREVSGNFDMKKKEGGGVLPRPSRIRKRTEKLSGRKKRGGIGFAKGGIFFVGLAGEQKGRKEMLAVTKGGINVESEGPSKEPARRGGKSSPQKMIRPNRKGKERSMQGAGGVNRI